MKNKEKKMLDFSKYENHLPYPNRPKKPMLADKHTVADVRKYAEDMEKYEADRVVFEEDRRKYNEKTVEVDEQFWKDVFDDFGISQKHPKAALLRRLAWQQGHSAGYSEVYNYASELADFLRD
jgi:hypothetical protein